MNIQINVTDKTLKLTETVNLGELEKVLLKLFPDNSWREYKLETNVTINNWSNPIIIDHWNYPNYPWISQPYYYTSNGFTINTIAGGNDFNVTSQPSETFTSNNGVYNVAINA